ncbi:CE295 protein, partial [Indicator maculatus]|nr:CE295 protein [Indicator maculatus]
MQGTPCDLSSTISSGSFLTSETSDASRVDTGLSSDSIEDRILREAASCPWNSLLPSAFQLRQENSARAAETQLPEGEMSLDQGSQTQEILGKHTGDLTTCSENNTGFKALAAELDFSEMERHFPNFHQQVFQPLEPSLDSDTSSSCSQYRVPQVNREFSKTSKFSTKSPDMFTSLAVGNATLEGQRSNLPLSLEKTRPNNIASGGETAKENVT